MSEYTRMEVVKYRGDWYMVKDVLTDHKGRTVLKLGKGRYGQETKLTAEVLITPEDLKNNTPIRPVRSEPKEKLVEVDLL